MDAVITRIIEIEKESAADIERAESESRIRIEEHRRALEEEKDRLHARITSFENQRLSQVLQDLNDKTMKALADASQAYEVRFSNAAAVLAVKEKILAMLLAG